MSKKKLQNLDIIPRSTSDNIPPPTSDNRPWGIIQSRMISRARNPFRILSHGALSEVKRYILEFV